MIRVVPPAEPDGFNETCRQEGVEWLDSHPDARRPKDYWSPFKAKLAEGFGDLCGYGAMYEPVGTVDHYLSFANHRELAYEWSTYRYASAWINSSKANADDAILDPFAVADGWFEVLLPSLQLVATSSVPAAERDRAEETLARLHLRDDERVIRQRREWLRMYESSELSLDGLEKKAPLIARAVRKRDGNL